jgi:surface antigen
MSPRAAARTVTLAAAVAVFLPSSAAPAQRFGPRIVYGYPYAGSCPDAGLAERVDRWGMYECNCTSYVAWALAANGQRIDWFIAGAMDAWNWPHVARLGGLRVGSKPEPGAVAVWPKQSRPFGHLAYVIAVGRNGDFDVAEYNYSSVTGFEPFLFDRRTGLSSRHTTFIYVPTRRA